MASAIRLCIVRANPQLNSLTSRCGTDSEITHETMAEIAKAGRNVTDSCPGGVRNGMTAMIKETLGAAPLSTAKLLGGLVLLLGLAIKPPGIRKVLWLVLLGFLGWEGLRLAAPAPPEYSEAQLRMADRLASVASDWIRRLPLQPGPAVFGNLGRDRFGVVSRPLRDAIWRTDRFDLLDRGPVENIAARFSWPMITYGSCSELVREARARKARYAIGGELLRFEDLPGEQVLRAHLYVWDANASRLVDEKTIEINPNALGTPLCGGTPKAPGRLAITYRLFFWVLIAGLMPFVVLVRPKGLLVNSGNLGLFLLLALLTAAGGSLLHVFAGAGLDSFWSGLVLLVLVPADAYYNFKILAFFRENCV